MCILRADSKYACVMCIHLNSIQVGGPVYAHNFFHSQNFSYLLKDFQLFDVCLEIVRIELWRIWNVYITFV